MFISILKKIEMLLFINKKLKIKLKTKMEMEDTDVTAVGYYYVKKPENCMPGEEFYAVVDGGTRVAITCPAEADNEGFVRFRMPVMEIPHRLYQINIPDRVIPGEKFTVKFDDNGSQLILTCPANFDTGRTMVVRLPI